MSTAVVGTIRSSIGLLEIKQLYCEVRLILIPNAEEDVFQKKVGRFGPLLYSFTVVYIYLFICFKWGTRGSAIRLVSLLVGEISQLGGFFTQID